MPAFKEFPLSDAVEPVPGEMMRFRVRSRTNPKMNYLVDLEECGLHGACGCQHFQMRLLPRLKEDRSLGKPQRRRRCYHIDQALLFFAELHVRLLIRARDKEKYLQRSAKR